MGFSRKAITENEREPVRFSQCGKRRQGTSSSISHYLFWRQNLNRRTKIRFARHRKLGNEKNNYAPKVQIQRDATVPEMALCSLVPLLYSSTRPYTNQCSKKQPDFPIFERKMASTGPSSLLACAERTAGSTRSACPPTNHGGLGGPQATIRTRNVP